MATSDWDPDPKFWKTIGWGEACTENLRVYKHQENIGSSHDKYLITLDTDGGQPFCFDAVWPMYDRSIKELEELNERGRIAFVVHGNAEIFGVINAFKDIEYLCKSPWSKEK